MGNITAERIIELVREMAKIYDKAEREEKDEKKKEQYLHNWSILTNLLSTITNEELFETYYKIYVGGK